MKAIQNGNAESEKYLMLRKQLITGLGVLIVFFLAALMFMGFLQGWNSASGVDLLINEHPHGRRNIINEVINVIRLLVIFSFVGIGLRFVFKYREQAEKLKSNGTSHKATNQDESKRQN
jgi:flagellar biosynthesis protein FliR